MSNHGLDMRGLDEAYDIECVSFFGLTSAWRELTRAQVITNPVTVKGEHYSTKLNDTQVPGSTRK